MEAHPSAPSPHTSTCGRWQRHCVTAHEPCTGTMSKSSAAMPAQGRIAGFVDSRGAASAASNGMKHASMQCRRTGRWISKLTGRLADRQTRLQAGRQAERRECADEFAGSTANCQAQTQGSSGEYYTRSQLEALTVRRLPPCSFLTPTTANQKENHDDLTAAATQQQNISVWGRPRAGLGQAEARASDSRQPELSGQGGVGAGRRKLVN